MENKEKILSLNPHYRSGKSNLSIDFFGPCLIECVHYKRAVGYFSSSVLVSWAAALPRLAKEDNISIRLLVSPNLTPKDKEALINLVGADEREELLQKLSDQIVLDALEFAQGNQTVEKRMRLFSWLVATEKLELRFAYPHHVKEPGIFHEKIGIFEFPWGGKISFTGSANESEMGHSKNYESVDVFRDWIPSDVERVVSKEEEFDEAWDGEAEGLKVKKLSKQVLNKVKNYSPTRSIFDKDENSLETEADNVPKKWRHQDEAINVFIQKEKGILEMATGTGKTRTALRICNCLVNNDLIDSIIISTDGNDLLNQWYINVLKEVCNFKKRFSLIRHYEMFKEREFFIDNPKRKILLVSRPELPQALMEINKTLGQTTLLIHDEVHKLGSPANRRDLDGLADNIRYRVGLSATPDREYDEEGNQFISNHIGPVIYCFELPEAIKRGILCPFNYYPIEYEITDEDKRKLKQLKARFEASKKTKNSMSEKELWRSIALVYKKSEAKIPLFKEFITGRPELLKRCIIFVATADYAEKIFNIVHEFNSDFHTYFSGEDSETLKRFAEGELDCLITCHRLSEGIDIQSLNNVILFASDRARLELIQRIGRCLRSDSDNPDKVANVIDFIRTNNSEGNDEFQTSDELRMEWLTELSKIRPEE